MSQKEWGILFGCWVALSFIAYPVMFVLTVVFGIGAILMVPWTVMGMFFCFRMFGIRGTPRQPRAKRRKWHYQGLDGQSIGPIKREKIRVLMINGAITDDTMVWHKDIPNWVPVKDCPEIYAGG